MLAQQQSFQFSEYTALYDLIVPKDNLLRKINDLIDFTFIYDELVSKYCSNNGRTAESPIRMFKYLLLKTIYTVSDVDTVIGDSAYSGRENLKLTSQQSIKVVAKLNPSITQGCRKEEDKFDYNKDADMFVCPAGHLSIRKARQGRTNVAKNQFDTYYFDVEKCKSCPLRDGCYKSGSKTKTYSIKINSDLHKEQIAFQESDYYKEKAKHRYKIEAKNSELKNVHGFGRAISYGINNMQMQGAMAIFTVNLKRIIKLAM